MLKDGTWLTSWHMAYCFEDMQCTFVDQNAI